MILTADYLLTGDRNTVVEQGAVAIRGDRILMVGTQADVCAAYPDDEVKAYPGKTLMPGMIDMHVHLAFFNGKKNEKDFLRYPPIRALFAAKRMADTLKAGVTTIRDVGSADRIGTALTLAAKAGYLEIPRIYTCGLGIAMTGGHGTKLYDLAAECDGDTEIRKAIRTNFREGANYTKILTSEAYRGVEMRQEEIDAAVDETHRLGYRIAAHAGFGPSLQMCIDAGVDTIEHGTHLTEQQCIQMRDNDQTWVPTVYIFESSLEDCRKMPPEQAQALHIDYYIDSCACYENDLKRLYDTGVRIACGTDTDCDNFPEASPVYMECYWLVQCGLTPLQAIECATKNGAEALGGVDEFGMLKAGLCADIIAVEGKPFEDITALGHVAAVYRAGKEIV